MTPTEFRRGWGPELLVRAGDSDGLPPEAARFLTEAGLPGRFTVDHPELPLHCSFERLADGVRRLADEPLVGPPLPAGWPEYLVLGEQRFSNGSALFCVEAGSGRLVAIDVELESPVQLVNSGVDSFAASLLAAVEWSAEQGADERRWPATVDELAQRLTVLDPPGLADERGFWPALLAEIRRQPAGAVHILRWGRG